MDEKLLLEDDVMPKPKRRKMMIDPDREKLMIIPEEEVEEDVMIEKNFLNLPEDVIIEKILLKLPAKSLSKLRYVSKYLWSLITDPSFVKLHRQHSSAQPNNHLLLITSYAYPQRFQSYEDGTFDIFGRKSKNYACEFTTAGNREAVSNIPPEDETEIIQIHCPFKYTEFRASCNGLLYLHRRTMVRKGDILNYIWNPCTKEYKELPPPPSPVLELDIHSRNNDDLLRGPYSSSCGFCGFGYDRTNNEYKILHYEYKILHYENRVDPHITIYDGLIERYDFVSSTIEFKLYTLGTNTWTSIVDNPYKSFFFSEPYKRIGLLVNGALHWIMCLSNTACEGKIVSFDIEKEVFREVQKPPYWENQPPYYMSLQPERNCLLLQVLQECLCMCHIYGGREEDAKIDIWMLQDYNVMDSWTKLCNVVITNMFNCLDSFRLLRYFENGKILMVTNMEDVIVYNPINHKARLATKFKESIANKYVYYMDYTESLVSLNSGTYIN